MKVEKKFGIVFVFMTGVSCSSIETVHPNAKTLENEVENSYTIEGSPDLVWKAVSEKMNDNVNCVLVQSDKEKIASWCEAVDKWRDLGQDTAQPKPVPGGVNLNHFEGVAQDVQNGVAITTVYVLDDPNGAQLQIRRMYYGPDSFAGISHSRGDYEKGLYEEIKNIVKKKI